VFGRGVYVIDAMKGSVTAVLAGQGMLPDVCWASAEDGKEPMLLVAIGSALKALRLSE